MERGFTTMTDTYDEQIEAILAEDPERFLEALGDEIYPGEDRPILNWDKDEPDTLYSRAWGATPDTKTSLFSNLSGLPVCASQIEKYANLPGLKNAWSKIAENMPLHLSNPRDDEKPTREILEEFARRQRLFD